MRTSGPCRLKRTSADQADAIILAFNHKWCKPLSEGKVHVVFRKQGPRAFVPDTMYLYASAPISAIVAKASVISYETMPKTEAFLLADRGAIDRTELELYAQTVDQLLVMEIGPVSFAQTPVTCAFLAEHHNFWPSSTFIPLSASGVRTLEDLGRFQTTAKGSIHD